MLDVASPNAIVILTPNAIVILTLIVILILTLTLTRSSQVLANEYISYKDISTCVNPYNLEAAYEPLSGAAYD